MLDTFHVIVPALDQPMPGVLRPVEGPTAGVLLLDGTADHAPLVPHLFTELELYLHAAELATLRLSIPPHASIGRRVSTVLGSVSLLRSMGAMRVVVITSALDPLASWEEARAGTLAEFMQRTEQGRALPEIVEVVRHLVTTIRQVADSTVGVATLLAHPDLAGASPAAVAPLSRPIRGTRRRTFEQTNATTMGTRPSPAALLLPLPGTNDDEAAHQASVPLVTRLYSWSLALAQQPSAEAAPDTLAGGARLLPVQSTRDDAFVERKVTLSDSMRIAWSAQLAWADDQWEEIRRQQAARSRGAAAATASREATAPRERSSAPLGASLRAARSAWPHLDVEARRAWLSVCSQVFRYT